MNINETLNEVESVLSNTQAYAGRIARILAKVSPRHITSYQDRVALASIKRQLRDLNIQTRKFKGE